MKSEKESVSKGTATPIIEVDEEHARVPTVEDEILFKLTEKLFLESLDIGKDFSKSMITICMGLFPVYLGIISFLLGRPAFKNYYEAFIFLLPCSTLIIALVFFLLSYFPAISKVTIIAPEQSAYIRERIIKRRRVFTLLGILVLLSSQILLALLVVGVIH